VTWDERGLLYLEDALARDLADSLLGWLDATPLVEGAPLLAQSFCFSPPVIAGQQVAGRAEARCGTPVWDGTGPAAGPPIPEELTTVLDLANTQLESIEQLWSAAGEAPRPLTSIYVDRYPTGGHFVPHVDRAIYGPVIAGLSVGPGSCRLRFLRGGLVLREQVLAPRSLYAFTGALRWAPVEHEVVEVRDLRYGITMRAGALGGSADA